MSQFLEHLKERKLVQWALAYIAAAFASLQGIDIVAQRFGWPDAIERALIVALAIGFFVTLVLAWYHGERGRQRATGTELLIIALLLSQYGSNNGAWLFHMVWSPRGRALRALAEFAAFARHIGWTALWDKYGAPDVCKRSAPGEYACE